MNSSHLDSTNGPPADVLRQIAAKVLPAEALKVLNQFFLAGALNGFIKSDDSHVSVECSVYVTVG